MKNNKLAQKIEDIYSQIETLETDLNNNIAPNETDKAIKLQVGSKVLKLQELVVTFTDNVQTYIEILEGDLEDFSDKARDYYNLIQELKKPIEEGNSEEVKKIKELINSLKDNGTKL